MVARELLDVSAWKGSTRVVLRGSKSRENSRAKSRHDSEADESRATRMLCGGSAFSSEAERKLKRD
jgi:hypothetical protein